MFDRFVNRSAMILFLARTQARTQAGARAVAVVALALALFVTGLAPAQQAHAQSAVAAPSLRHFVEFRARVYAPFGHSYIVYGATDPGGAVVQSNTIGLAPRSRVFGYALGATGIPVPATIEPSPEDLNMQPLVSFRVDLSPDQYARLLAFVAQQRAKDHYWSQLFYNCNNFTADLAHAVGGIEAPVLTAVIPPAYVAAMSLLNQ